MRLSPAMALATVVGSLAYLGLTILCRGGVSAFFAEPALVALTVVYLAITVAALFSEGNLSRGDREDRSNRWIIAAVGVNGLLMAVLPPDTDRLNILSLDGTATRWAGVVLFTVGSALRLWPVFVLGHRFSGLVAIQPGHQLETAGIYAVIRHPSYLGLLLGSLGWALAFRSGIGVLLTILLLPPLLARIRAEEALLLSQFGDAYAAYRARTSRLIPGLY